MICILAVWSIIKKKSQRLTPCFIKRNHVSIWSWIQKFKLQNIASKKKKILEYSCIQKDETIIKVGSEYVWLDWVAIEPWNKRILGFDISKERNMFVVKEKFISGLTKVYDKHSVSTDGGA
jgi:putative transposase